jgi:hypothetical protein
MTATKEDTGSKGDIMEAITITLDGVEVSGYSGMTPALPRWRREW